MATIFDLGDLVRASAAFTDINGTALDPDVVKVSVRTPAGVVTTYTYPTDAQVVKDSTGNYHVDVNANEAGAWHCRWFSTGNGQAAEENFFRVNDARAV